MKPVIERVFDAIIGIDEHLTLKFLSDTGTRWFGSAVPEPGTSMLDFVHEDDRAQLESEVSQKSEAFSLFIRLLADGETRWTCLRATRMDIINQYMICVLDISEFKVQDSALVHAAEHDALTKLPNRVRITDVINDHIYETTSSFYVALLDLDGFKKVNDTMGHHRTTPL